EKKETKLCPLLPDTTCNQHQKKVRGNFGGNLFYNTVFLRKSRAGRRRTISLQILNLKSIVNGMSKFSLEKGFTFDVKKGKNKIKIKCSSYELKIEESNVVFVIALVRSNESNENNGVS
ncbi:hypothetical protein POVCU2_0095710, partial [Plasmodium ovale curtisi]